MFIRSCWDWALLLDLKERESEFESIEMGEPTRGVCMSPSSSPSNSVSVSVSFSHNGHPCCRTVLSSRHLTSLKPHTITITYNTHFFHCPHFVSCSHCVTQFSPSLSSFKLVCILSLYLLQFRLRAQSNRPQSLVFCPNLSFFTTFHAFLPSLLLPF